MYLQCFKTALNHSLGKDWGEFAKCFLNNTKHWRRMPDDLIELDQACKKPDYNKVSSEARKLYKEGKYDVVNFCFLFS